MVKRVTPPEAQALLGEGWVYLDVRSIPEFDDGHPPGAANVPLLHFQGGRMVPNPDFAAVVAANFPKDAKIVVGCKAGGRSLRAAQKLSVEGFSSVVDQRAGWDGARDPFGQLSEPGWSRAGLPAEQGQPSGRSWEDMKGKAG